MNAKLRRLVLALFLSVIFIFTSGSEARAVELDCTCNIKCTNDALPGTPYTFPPQHFADCDLLVGSLVAPLNKPQDLCGLLGTGWENDEALCQLTLTGLVQLYGPAVRLYFKSIMPAPAMPAPPTKP